MSSIELRAVANQVLRRVDLTIKTGELFVLVGPSGAGKTSLLNVVAGLMPHRGQVRFDGELVNRLPPQKRRVGYVFQDLLLFPHLSVENNLMLAMRNLGWGRRQKRARRKELLEMLNISYLAPRSPGSLSGGERQRAALARALASVPQTLLLDEPFNNLDFRLARHLRREFKSLQRRMGITTLFVTHNMEEAGEIADRMAVLNQGELAEAGPASELLQGAGGGQSSFLERANRLAPGGARAVGNGLVEARWAGLRLLAIDRAIEIRALSVLPSKVVLGREPPAGPDVNRFQGTVRRLEKNHSVCHVQLDIAGKPLMADVPLRSWAMMGIKPGQKVHVLINLVDLKIY